MTTEYTDCAELKRLIVDQKIKSSAIKRYLLSQGIIFTTSNADKLSEDIYTIFLGGQEIEKITQMIVDEGNYEKSTLLNAKLNNECAETDILDFFTDRFNTYRSYASQDYKVEQPLRTETELNVRVSYKRKLPGKNKLIQEETRFLKIIIRKKSESEVAIDIRQPSSIDIQKALELLEVITNGDGGAEVSLSHLNLNALTAKNKVAFFDKISAYIFKNWRLQTITGITVRKCEISGEDDLDEVITEEDDVAGALTGISQAVLNGKGLRSNKFVKKSLEQGYYISSMNYRYTCLQEAAEFIISVSSKDKNLRIDMEKSYCDLDGTLYIQPFTKILQNEIITDFQTAANNIFYKLIEEQIESVTDN